MLATKREVGRAFLWFTVAMRNTSGPQAALAVALTSDPFLAEPRDLLGVFGLSWLLLYAGTAFAARLIRADLDAMEASTA